MCIRDRATEFANSFNDFIADGPNGDHAAIISTVSEFTSAVSELLLDCKGLAGSMKQEQVDDFLTLVRRCAREAEFFLEDLLSEHLKGSEEEKTDTVINGNVDMQEKLHELAVAVEDLVPVGKLAARSGDLASYVDSEMEAATQSIITASQRLPQLLETADFSGDLEVNKNILANAMAIIDAILALIKAAAACQDEIVAQGRGSASRSEFYKKNNRWTEGLLSAAKAVATSTKNLISTADGLLASNNSYEEFIVASNDVAASTAQLVAASRVKSGLHSTTQRTLEECSKTVSTACRTLVQHIQSILNKAGAGADIQEVDFSKLSVHENKTAEMEQQVQILKLENALERARKRLGEIRQYSYRDGDSDSE